MYFLHSEHVQVILPNRICSVLQIISKSWINKVKKNRIFLKCGITVMLLNAVLTKAPLCSLRHLLHFLSLGISPSLLVLASHYNSTFSEVKWCWCRDFTWPETCMHTQGYMYLQSRRHWFMRWLLSCHTRVDLRIERDLQYSFLQNKEEERVRDTAAEGTSIHYKSRWPVYKWAVSSYVIDGAKMMSQLSEQRSAS